MDIQDSLDKLDKKVDTADKLADKLNKISVKFTEQLDNAQELIVCGDDLENQATEVITDVKNLPAQEYHFNLDLLPQILNLENMMSDVRYIRETLQENSMLGRKLLKVISQEIEFEPNAELLASYSQLSMTITDNMRLFLSCYRDISHILINIAKLTREAQRDINTQNNIQVNIQNPTAEVLNTADLIKQLSQLSKGEE